MPPIAEAVASDTSDRDDACALDEERFGEQRLVCGDGAAGDRRSSRAARRCSRSARAAIVETADGELVFVESYAPRPDMYIFGASDHVTALVTMGKFLGYRVTVCDAAHDVRHRASASPTPTSSSIEWPDRFLATAPVDARTAICMMTHDLKFDVPALQQGAGVERRLHRRDRQREDAHRARRSGSATRASATPTSPASTRRSAIQIGARTPEEVAVTIAAQIIESNVVARAKRDRVRSRARPSSRSDVLHSGAEAAPRALAVLCAAAAGRLAR